MACPKNDDYGQNGQKQLFVRKNSAVSDLDFTDKCSEKRLLSVNTPHNCQKITDKTLKNVGLSVKYVLLTDKSAKKGTLSVKFERNLGESPKIKKSVPSRHEF